MREIPRAGYPEQVTVLDDILAGVREDLAERQDRVSLDELKQRTQNVRPAIDAEAVLRQDGVSVIAEVKRSSPSKGVLAEIADPAHLAMELWDYQVIHLNVEAPKAAPAEAPKAPAAPAK